MSGFGVVTRNKSHAYTSLPLLLRVAKSYSSGFSRCFHVLSRADNSQEDIWRWGCGRLHITRRGSFLGDLSHSIARDRCICRCPDSLSSPRQLYQRGLPVFCTLALSSGVLWDERASGWQGWPVDRSCILNRDFYNWGTNPRIGEAKIIQK